MQRYLIRAQERIDYFHLSWVGMMRNPDHGTFQAT